MNWTYISGPVTGDKDYYKHFWSAETYLKIYRNAEPINPVKVNEPLPESANWENYMNVSMALLEQCSAIAMLPGWEESRGANREYGYAIDKATDWAKKYSKERVYDTPYDSLWCGKLTVEELEEFEVPAEEMWWLDGEEEDEKNTDRAAADSGDDGS